MTTLVDAMGWADGFLLVATLLILWAAAWDLFRPPTGIYGPSTRRVDRKDA